MFSIEERIITGSEPATLDEAKTYFRTEESEGVEDDLIEGLISTARATIEKLIDRSLVNSIVAVYAKEWKGYLPLAPIVSGSIEISGVATLQGNKYPYVIVGNGATISYVTEAFNAPDLKYAVLELALFWYERGDFKGGEIPMKIRKQINSYSRLNFIA